MCQKKSHKLLLPKGFVNIETIFFFFVLLRTFGPPIWIPNGRNNNQQLIYLCGQNDLMPFLVIDRLIWVELHPIDKTVMKCYSLDE